MSNKGRRAAFWLSILVGFWVTACGGGGGGSTTSTQPSKTTPTVTVTPGSSSITAAQGLTVTVTVSGSGGTPTGMVTLSSGTYTSTATTLTSGSASIAIPAGALAAGNDTLTASYMPDATSSATYYSSSGTAQVTVTLIIPTVTVTPGSSSITTVQGLTVTVTVSGSGGTPTGTVTLSSGTYTSTATTLTSGSASIAIPAGALATGTDTLTASYTPDANSSSTYKSSSGTASVTVMLIIPTVTVSPGANSITTAQALTVTVTVSGGGGTPTGMVTLSSGNYTSAATTLTTGGTSINVPAGSLAAGNDTLTASYTPDANSSSTYKSSLGTASVTVTLITPTVTVSPGSNNITTVQPLTVTVGVSGSGGPPTGTVTLSSGTYASAATTLTAGSASINVPAGSLAAGSDTLTASYTPDTASSSIYSTATGTSSAVTVTQVYVLTVNSTNPSSGVAITVTYPPTALASQGTTSFTLTGVAGTMFGLLAPATVNGNNFSSWTGGCTSISTVNCDVTLNGNTTVTAKYTIPVAVTPNPATAIIGGQLQFTAALSGTVSSAVTWSVAAPSGSSMSPGTISTSGLYTTPYPAPATVTVTATSTADTSKSGSATVTLSPPLTATGPALSVNVGSPGNPISPDIYGMDAYLLHATAADVTAVANANITIDRWGGDSTERYNYQLDVTNDIDDWYFENQTGNGGDGWPVVSGVKAFDALVESNNNKGIKTLGTVPVLGWVAKDSTSCSFPRATYPNQLAVNGKAAFDSGRGCGSGIYPDGVSGCTSTGGCNITGNDPTVTSIAEPPPTPPGSSAAATTAWADATWTGGWVNYLVSKFGAGNSGTGVAIYDLDNEPSWWSSGSFDVHPNHFTYDEVTNGGIGTALAIKTADPTAQVSGPVMDYWWAYFYSMEDIRNGWNTGPCYGAWSHPADRTAHGGLPFIQYYLSQFAQAETTYGKRLLDYLDLHTYFAPQYPTNSGNSVAFTTAGDTGAQQARLNSTRVFWDPTYTDPDTHIAPAYGGYQQPNYFTDPNYTTSCTAPAQAPQLIPMMKAWVTGAVGSYAGYFYPGAKYPGTKLAIDEYNWGGMESINGALAQADILGIFGREGLDLGTMWPTEDPSEQIPGMMAFAIYRNYDGNKSTFGDTVLPSTSTNSSSSDAEGQLAVYGAQRNSDSAITVMVINKTYGPLTSTVSLLNFTASSGTTAQVYQYSNANLSAIVAQPAVAITPPATGSTTSTIGNYTFPAQSITLFVVPD